jgi:DnaJ-class molecular chaperone
MRALLFLCGLFAALTAVLAWTKEDYEIFDLVSELEQHEGELKRQNLGSWCSFAALGAGTTFYSLLGISPSASAAELSKAYKKLSVKLHPDKVRFCLEHYRSLPII